MKPHLTLPSHIIVFLVMLSCTPVGVQLPIVVKSPGEAIGLSVELRDNFISYSVTFRGNLIVEASSLKLEFEKPIQEGFEVIQTSTESFNDEWSPVYGENRFIKDRYHLLLVGLREKGPLKRLINIEFRVYNEGIAFRYVLPEQEYVGWTILNECSEFKFRTGAKAYPIESTEQTFSRVPVDITTIAEKVLTPLTIQLDNSIASVLEANVENFPRMHLKNSVDTILTTLLLGEAIVQAPFSTPWRAILLAENEGQLIENESLVLNLNQSCAIRDISWIQPGKTISNEGSVPLNTMALKKLVDFASENGFKYVQLDWGWYGTEVQWEDEWVNDFKKMMPEKYKDSGWVMNTRADPYTVASGFVPYGWTERWRKSYTLVDLDLQELISYGKFKNVGICLYIEAGSTLPSQDMDQLFKTYKDWGVAGLKPGFVQYGEQENTVWIRNMVKTAAKNQFWLCIHDTHVPDGFERTYPNLMISEGGGGQEGRHPVVQDLMLPFTRCLVGAFDYTPFFFSKGKTNAHMLAFMVVYYGPAQTVRGAYPALNSAWKSGIGSAELGFIRKVPATWDETKIINARIGNYLTVARKNGDNWFIGSMNSETPQSFEIDLDFLDPGKIYRAIIYGDDEIGIAEGWRPVKTEEITVTNADLIKIDLATAGGCVIILEPEFPLKK